MAEMWCGGIVKLYISTVRYSAQALGELLILHLELKVTNQNYL